MNPAVARLEAPNGPQDARWLKLRTTLWPDDDDAHRRDMQRVWDRGDLILLAFTAAGDLAGFVEVAKRQDYVNGTSSSPVAFVEGLFVTPHCRQRGIARALVEAVAQWARAQGVTELASDTPLDNTVSRAVHGKLGFDETERVVFFRRVLEEQVR